MATDYVYELTWSAADGKFTVANTHAIPAKYSWGGKAEHIDFGHKRFVILTPIGCDNTATSSQETVDEFSVIANPSAKFFAYDTVFEADTGSDLNLDGDASIADNALIDNTEYACALDGDGVVDDLCGTAIDYDDGWTCRDLPATEQTSEAWLRFEGAVNVGGTNYSVGHCDI